MKTIIMIVFVIFLIVINIVALIRKKNNSIEIKNDNGEIQEGFYTIDSGNQDSLNFYLDFNQEMIDELHKEQSTDTTLKGENGYRAYMFTLFEELPKLCTTELSDTEFFNKLTRGQKVFYSIFVFEGEVGNGGIYQFFYNDFKLAIAVYESIEELKLEELRARYEKCFIEYTNSVNKIVKIKEEFNDTTIDWENRWKSFNSGYSEIPSAKEFEKYYFDENTQKLIYRTLIEYMDMRLAQFFKK